MDADAATGTRRLWLGAFSWLSFFLALLCKEMALTLPLILIYYEHVYRSPGGVLGSVAKMKKYAPYFAVIGLYLILRVSVIGTFSIDHQKVPMSAEEFVLSILSLFEQYGWKLLYPFHLQIWYNFKPTESLLDPYVLGLLAFGALVILPARMKRLDATVLFCLVWIFLTLLPVMNIRGVGKNVFTERYLYIPSIGFCFLISYLASKVLGVMSPAPKMGVRSAAYFSIFAALLTAYSYRTVTRNRDWKEDAVLFKKTLESVEAVNIRNLLGVTYAEKGLIDEAIRQFNIALASEPTYSAHNNLGAMYMRKGAVDMAIAQFQAAAQLKPRSIDAHYNLAIAYQSRGTYEPAVREISEVLRLDPGHARARYDLATLYLSKGLIDPAIREYQTLLKTSPEQVDARNNLAVCYYQKGRIADAIQELETAVRLKPGHKDATRNLAEFRKLSPR